MTVTLTMLPREEGAFLQRACFLGWGEGENPTLSGVDSFLLNQQDRHFLSKKSYLPASGEPGTRAQLASSRKGRWSS